MQVRWMFRTTETKFIVWVRVQRRVKVVVGVDSTTIGLGPNGGDDRRTTQRDGDGKGRRG